MEEDNPLTNYLADHPRMIGVVFMIGLLLMQASTAMGAGSATSGP
ncbi:DUF7503 family protein [Haloarchaeobius sp. DFWS5]